MHGVNICGWLSQRDSNQQSYVDSFFTENDIIRIARSHLDHIRIPLDYWVLESEDGSPIDSGFRYLDNAVSWCRRYGIHIVLNLHDIYGYNFNSYMRNPDEQSFFRNEKYQERYYRLWENIVMRYSSDTDMIAFEIIKDLEFSELESEWRDIASTLYHRIRRIAPAAHLIMGSARVGDTVIYPVELSDDHTVFSFHCFDPVPFTHQKAYWLDNMPMDLDVHYPETVDEYMRIDRECGLDDARIGDLSALPGNLRGRDILNHVINRKVQLATVADVPLYCCSYGVIEQAPKEDTLRWIEDITSVFDEYGIGRALWNYKSEDFGIMDHAYDGIRDRIIKLL